MLKLVYERASSYGSLTRVTDVGPGFLHVVVQPRIRKITRVSDMSANVTGLGKYAMHRIGLTKILDICGINVADCNRSDVIAESE